jgi:hypothetical protein
MISSPRLVSLPEWEEQIESTLSKEYTRKFQLEKARSEKRRFGDLDPPKGLPVKKDAGKKKFGLKKKMAVEVLEAVSEEPTARVEKATGPRDDSTVRRIESVRDDSTIRGFESVRGYLAARETEGVLDVSTVRRTKSVRDDSTIRRIESVQSGDAAESPVVETDKPKQKRVRIISQATNSYGREFEEPRATPKPPKASNRHREDSIFPPPRVPTPPSAPSPPAPQYRETLKEKLLGVVTAPFVKAGKDSEEDEENGDWQLG